jgi:transcriptional regulator with XRE-family HTH domain
MTQRQKTIRGRMVDLRTARFLRGKSQLSLEAETGVFQSKISRFEKHGIKCLTNNEKTKLQKALKLQIDWDATVKFNNPLEDPKLTDEEKGEIQTFLNFLMLKADPVNVVHWLSSYKTGHAVYEAVKQAMEQFTFQIPAPKITRKRI